jgi:hypothetical protein
LPQLLARDDLTRVLYQQRQDLKRLIVKLDPRTVFPQLPVAKAAPAETIRFGAFKVDLRAADVPILLRRAFLIC